MADFLLVEQFGDLLQLLQSTGTIIYF